MLSSLLAVLGVGAAAWTLSSDVWREEVRSSYQVRKAVVHRWLLAIGGFAVLFPFAIALFKIAPCPVIADVSEFGPAVGDLVLVVLTVFLVWIAWPGEWTPDRVSVIRPRIEQLLRERRASTAAAVVAKFAPRSEIEKPYVKLMDRCLKDPAFVRSAVNEQPELAARLLKEHGVLMRDHSDRLIRAAFFEEPRTLVAELRDCENLSPDRIGYWIPEECLLLHALFDDAEVAERLAVWNSIARPVLEKLLRRHYGLDDGGEDTLPSYGETQKLLSSEIGAAIHFFRIMVFEAMRQGIVYHMWIPFYVHFTRAILKLLPEENPSAGREYPTLYHHCLEAMMESLADIALASRRLDAENANRPDVDSSGHDLDNIPKACVETYARCVRAISQSPRASARLTDRIQERTHQFKLELQRAGMTIQVDLIERTMERDA